MPEQTSSPSAEPTTTQTPAPTEGNESPTPDEPVILTISGAGVSGETTWTLSQLKSLQDGYRVCTYSTTNNWPVYGYMTARGISLPYLLMQAGVLDSAASFKFIAADGYNVTVTRNQVFGGLYTFANHSSAGSGGASAIESVVAWEWGDGNSAGPENLRPFFGQSGPQEVNTSVFVKDLCKIEVYTSSAGVWAAPGASISDGSAVPAGTELALLHENMDSVHIYYTLDGSEPNYYSPVYNLSTSYFQPQLIQPLELSQSVTVKAFAAALGRERSQTVTFVITVE
jgi:hypothetical protein